MVVIVTRKKNWKNGHDESNVWFYTERYTVWMTIQTDFLSLISFDSWIPFALWSLRVYLTQGRLKSKMCP